MLCINGINNMILIKKGQKIPTRVMGSHRRIPQNMENMENMEKKWKIS